MASSIQARAWLISAYHNQGRWVVRCPVLDVDGRQCGDARRIEIGVDTVYVCPEHHEIRQILWPEPEMLVRIQQILEARPLDRNKNWLPGESINQLVAENRLHGVG